MNNCLFHLVCLITFPIIDQLRNFRVIAESIVMAIQTHEIVTSQYLKAKNLHRVPVIEG